jgi:hypothetical protein
MPTLPSVKPALWIAAALCVALPASASGAVTFGSDLGDSAESSVASGFTTVQRTLNADDQAPGGTTAPSDGVITSWRVKKGPPPLAGTLALRVVRGDTSVFQSQLTSFPSPNGIYRTPARVPVQAGDYIGIDTGAELPIGAAGGSWSYWGPLLGPTETLAPDAYLDNNQLLLNADLEPDADGDGFGDETQDQCPTDASTQGPCPDTDPPETTITKGAPSKLDKTKVKFKFNSDDAGATFECKVDSKPFKACTSPKTIKHLDDGKHKFKVIATDAAGNVDPSAAKDKFKVVG